MAPHLSRYGSTDQASLLSFAKTITDSDIQAIDLLLDLASVTGQHTFNKQNKIYLQKTFLLSKGQDLLQVITCRRQVDRPSRLKLHP
jgi:hypothetical protein